MRNFLRIFLSGVWLAGSVLLSSGCLYAQETEDGSGILPDDPRVKTGKLANGLTYYIIKNKGVPGKADFALVQKTGFSLEKKGERGMFRLLEDLALRGTRNFMDSSVVAYLNSLGIGPADLVFDTEADRSVYRIRGVPCGRSSTMDSLLLVLYNWMCSINIDEEDVSREIPFLQNRLMAGWDARKRMDRNLIQSLYPRSPYGNGAGPVPAEECSRFTSKEIRNFYYKWFRPDLQAVVVVGDVDPGSMETRIGSIFATIPKSVKGEARRFYIPKTFSGSKVFVLKDKEFDRTEISVDWLSSPLPEKYAGTRLPLAEKFLSESLERILRDRLRTESLKRNVPLFNIKVENGRLGQMQNRCVFSVSFETLPNRIYSSLAFLREEIDRLAEYGVTETELMISKEVYFREADRLYENREQLPNEVYGRRAAMHFLEGFSLASTELRREYAKELLPTITRGRMSQYAGAVLGNRDHTVIVCRLPEVEGGRPVSESRLLSSFTNTLMRPRYLDPEADRIRWPKSPAGGGTGKAVSEVTEPETGARILILSNGATVVLKETGGSGDTLSFLAFSKGGWSVMDGLPAGSGEAVSALAGMGGWAGVSAPEWRRIFEYYNLSAAPRIGSHTEEVSGWALRDNAEKMFQLLNYNFTSRRYDESAFKRYKDLLANRTGLASLSPLSVFRDSSAFYNYAKRKYTDPLTVRAAERLDYDRLSAAVEKRFSNAADFVFVITGNLEGIRARELAIKYIGSIPGNVAGRENWRSETDLFAEGRADRHFLIQMQDPRTFLRLRYTVRMPYHLKNSIMCDMLRMWADRMALQSKIRLLAPGSEFSGELCYYPENFFVLDAVFETASREWANQILAIVGGELNRVAEYGIDPPLLESLVRELRERFVRERKTNAFWQQTMKRRYLTGRDFYTNYLDELEQITPEMFRQFVREMVYHGNRISVTMEGTTEDINAPDLMRDNAFVRDFFYEE